MALLLAAALAVVAALLPESVRPWNFAAFGSIAVFAAARGGRLGLPAGLALALGAKLVSDLLSVRQQGYDGFNLSMAAVYAGIALYTLPGLWLARRPDWLGVPAAVAGSTTFFLLTNAAAWWEMALPYDRSLGGLLHSYWMGLPFHLSTLASDVIFTGGLFAAHAVLVRATAPAAVRS